MNNVIKNNFMKNILMCDETDIPPTCQGEKRHKQIVNPNFLSSECKDGFKCDKETKKCIQKGSRNKIRRRKGEDKEVWKKKKIIKKIKNQLNYCQSLFNFFIVLSIFASTSISVNVLKNFFLEQNLNLSSGAIETFVSSYSYILSYSFLHENNV